MPRQAHLLPAVLGIGLSLLSAPTASVAETIPRVGVLAPHAVASAVQLGLREALSELGYLEGKNLIIEWRQVGGSVEEARPAVADLLRAKVDLIVAPSSLAARAALDATKIVPILFASGDPVATGLVASLARPGGNATGLSVASPELTAKRLELLRQIKPRARRILYLRNPAPPIGPPLLKEAQRAARTLGMQLELVEAGSARELEGALGMIQRSTADGALVAGDLTFLLYKAKIVRALNKARLPAVYQWREYHDHGALMSYGPSWKNDVGRRLAVYIDRILNGAKPSELPVEEVSKQDLIIDLRIARELGLEVPQALLLRADEVLR